MDRDSSVGIATRYGLDGPQSNPGGADIYRTVQNVPGAYTASCAVGTGFLTGVKQPGRGVDHSPSSSVQVEERAQLTSIPLWAFVTCSWVTFTLIRSFVT